MYSTWKHNQSYYVFKTVQIFKAMASASSTTLIKYPKIWTGVTFGIDVGSRANIPNSRFAHGIWYYTLKITSQHTITFTCKLNFTIDL